MKQSTIISMGIFIATLILGATTFWSTSSQAQSSKPWSQYVLPKLNAGSKMYDNTPAIRIYGESFVMNNPQSEANHLRDCEASISQNFQMLQQRGLAIIEVSPCEISFALDGDSDKRSYSAEIFFMNKN
jgi:hypothetical protein